MRRKCADILRLLLLLALMAGLLTGCGNSGTQNETQQPPETTVDPELEFTRPPTQPPVQVVMPDYELTYSGEMAQILSWEEDVETGGLRFSVKLPAGEMTVFTLLLNQAEGDMVKMKENGAGEMIPVSFWMEPVPENLSQEDELTFCTAQEVVNEVIDSLVLK